MLYRQYVPMEAADSVAPFFSLPKREASSFMTSFASGKRAFCHEKEASSEEFFGRRTNDIYNSTLVCRSLNNIAGRSELPEGS